MKQYRQTRDYILFVEAWCLLAFARLMIYFSPFKKIVTLLENNPQIEKTNKKVSPMILNEISISINRACRRSFWRTKCFEQALAGKIMLKFRRINSSVYFGVADNGTFMAHAWLECEGQMITGDKGIDKFTIINKF